MQKFSAIILLLGLLIYAADFLGSPIQLQATKPSHSCCGKMKKSPVEKTGKCTKECNPGDAYCTNCPLCYMATLKWPEIREKLFLEKTQFPILQFHGLAGFYGRAWKPPRI